MFLWQEKSQQTKHCFSYMQIFYIQNADITIFKQLSISFLREIEKERGRGAGKQELGVISNENFSLP